MASEVSAEKERLNQRIKDLEEELAAAKQVQERPEVERAPAAVQVPAALNPQAPEFVPKLEPQGIGMFFLQIPLMRFIGFERRKTIKYYAVAIYLTQSIVSR